MRDNAWLTQELKNILSEDQVVSGHAELIAFECDAYTVQKNHPEAITFPRTINDISNIIKFCNANSIPFTPRGAGTGLSGGSLPAMGGVLIVLTKMRRIWEIDIENRTLWAEAGSPNLLISKAVAGFGLHFAPDPSSQSVSTLGGNINENSGGPHTLKYGVTTDHIEEILMVDCEGEIHHIKSGFGPDIVGLIIGSEGTLGIVAASKVKLTPLPKFVKTLLAAFEHPRQASETVSDIISSGVFPAALEFMDGMVLEAVESAFQVGLPVGCGALLLIECDSNDEKTCNEEIEISIKACNNNGAAEIRIAKDAVERDKLWIARKKGIGALGRLAPSMVTHDGVVPRSKLPDILEYVYQVANSKNLKVANIFHAGDGNLHPIFLFDERNQEEVKSVIEAGELIMRKCIEVGGSVTGEHGIGIEKIDLLQEMYSKTDLRLQESVHDAFNPNSLCNPGKVLPSQKSCVEVRLRKRVAT